MAGRSRSGSGSPAGAVVASVLSVVLLAGVAIANPRALDRAVDRARSVLFGGSAGDHPGGPGGDRVSARSLSAEERACRSLVAAFNQARPPSDDPRALAQAIRVVQEECDANPQAQGLLRALQRLLDNARRHEGPHGKGHENHANGTPPGHSAGGEPPDPAGQPGGSTGDQDSQGQGGDAQGGTGGDPQSIADLPVASDPVPGLGQDDGNDG